jgi:hypothetical protein
MAQTYFGSTVRMGSETLTDAVDGGFAVLTQTTTVTTVSAGTAVSSTLTIPAYSQIIDNKFDSHDSCLFSDHRYYYRHDPG